MYCEVCWCVGLLYRPGLSLSQAALLPEITASRDLSHQCAVEVPLFADLCVKSVTPPYIHVCLCVCLCVCMCACLYVWGVVMGGGCVSL